MLAGVKQSWIEFLSIVLAIKSHCHSMYKMIIVYSPYSPPFLHHQGLYFLLRREQKF